MKQFISGRCLSALLLFPACNLVDGTPRLRHLAALAC
jgi:hypothetical protein